MQMREARDIAISAVVLALAFAIALTIRGGDYSSLLNPGILTTILIALFAVSLGFILHEMGHRMVAKKFNHYAEFRMFPLGLVIALASSFVGFIFAAPGAVFIHPKSDIWGTHKPITKRNSGLISIAGPLMNLLIVAVLLPVNLFYPNEILQLTVSINIWLGLFNLIPVPPLDGSKIFAWDKKIWLAIAIVFGVLFYTVSVI